MHTVNKIISHYTTHEKKMLSLQPEESRLHNNETSSFRIYSFPLAFSSVETRDTQKKSLLYSYMAKRDREEKKIVESIEEGRMRAGEERQANCGS